MSKRKALVGCAAVLCALAVVGAVWAAGAPSIDWHVVGSGGGRAEAAPYVLEGTIGQAVAGPAANGNLELCSGFWCGTGGPYRIYLPLVLRNR